jgi:hypothetical protein
MGQLRELPVRFGDFYAAHRKLTLIGITGKPYARGAALA